MPEADDIRSGAEGPGSAGPTAEAAIAGLGGLIISPSTPPEGSAAAGSTGWRPAGAAVCACSATKKAQRCPRSRPWIKTEHHIRYGRQTSVIASTSASGP